MGKIPALFLSVVAYRMWRSPAPRPRQAGGAADMWDAQRGRQAERPRDIPATGWKDVFARVRTEMAEDNLSIVAAGVAFFGLLAIIPALAAAVSIFGLFVSPEEFQQQFASVAVVLPDQARDVLTGQMERISGSADTALGWAAAGSLLLTLASAMKGAKALISAVGIAYDQPEDRGFLQLNVLAFAFTFGAVLFVIVSLTLIAALPAVIDLLPLPEALRTALQALRWPVLALLLMVGLALLYRFAPARRYAKWRWISWGAVLATVIWLAVSALFSFYVSNFGNYNETYGSLGAVAILLLWFYLSAYSVLLGAEFNAETEHQTARDSTTGPVKPLGERGAYVADTLGRARR